MRDIKISNLKDIRGGYISGSIFSGIASVFRILRDVGVSLGSSLRRVEEDKLCPLK